MNTLLGGGSHEGQLGRFAEFITLLFLLHHTTTCAYKLSPPGWRIPGVGYRCTREGLADDDSINEDPSTSGKPLGAKGCQTRLTTNKMAL